MFKALKLMMVISLICGSLMYSSSLYSAVWQVSYPKAEFEGDSRTEYPLRLLELGLSKTGVRYSLNPSKDYMRQNKAIRKLKENIGIDVIWSMTDTQREAEMLPIRIPLAKGLIGWRMFLTRQESEFYKSEINSLDSLRAFSPVQGIDWPDTKILQASGFNVVTSQSMLQGYDTLLKRNADAYPRSVIEIKNELQQFPEHTSLMVKPGIVIRYPTAMYFFVNKRNKTLANLIETGLKRAIADGSFDALFMQYHSEIIDELKLDEALVFNIANPLLPEMTPIAEPGYWYQ